jgi:hypothetical protein
MFLRAARAPHAAMPAKRKPWDLKSMPRVATEGLGIEFGWLRLGSNARHGRQHAAPMRQQSQLRKIIRRLTHI